MPIKRIALGAAVRSCRARHVDSIVPRETSVTCFADDLAEVTFRVRQALPHLLRVFDQVRHATRLRMNVAKTELVYFGGGCLADSGDALSRQASVGAPTGPDASEGF